MMSFVSTQQQFIADCNQIGINPQITGILAKIKNHVYKSVHTLTDNITLIAKWGNGLLPCVEIHCNLTDNILAKVNVGYWECQCDFLSAGYGLLEQCNLSDDALHEAQETINLMMSDCSCVI